MRRLLALLCALLTLTALVGCADKPVKQGMVTADSLTFICETVTDEKAGTVSVKVTVTNGSTVPLYLSAPELTDDAGNELAAYIDMTLDLASAEQSSISAAPSDLDALTETGLWRQLYFAARQSYSETRSFTGALPATLTVTVRRSTVYDAAPTVTTVTFPLKGEH